MKDTALYEHLLGLKTPWSVKTVDLSPVDQRVVVEVVLKKGAGCGSRNILMDAVPRQSHFAP
jgi:hypothetical protein